MSSDIVGIVWDIAFLAGLEELIKVGIVVLFRNTVFKIPSYFLFFAIEAWSKASVVYPHAIDLGASGTVAVLSTMSVIAGSSSFHILTSLLYAKATNLVRAVAFCTVIHTIINIFAKYLPSYHLLGYTTVPWIITIGSALALWGYYTWEKKRYLSRHKAGLGTSV